MAERATAGIRARMRPRSGPDDGRRVTCSLDGVHGRIGGRIWKEAMFLTLEPSCRPMSGARDPIRDNIDTR